MRERSTNMSKQQKDASTNDRLDKALNEIDVLPDADKEIIRVDSTLFKFSSIEFKLVENHQEAFDLEIIENRYTDYLLKYDYIVGDISYEKLRLRGFFDDHRKGVPIDMKISNLEDYLVEYCSFGSPYFVFERVDKETADPESYFKKRKPNRSNRSNQQNKRPNNRSNQKRNKQGSQQKQGTQANQSKQGTQQKQAAQGNQNKLNKPNNTQQNKPSGKAPNKPRTQKKFQVKKVETEPIKSDVKETQPKKKQSGNKKTFKIRKKTD